jgi:hypothetical protein
MKSLEQWGLSQPFARDGTGRNGSAKSLRFNSRVFQHHRRKEDIPRPRGREFALVRKIRWQGACSWHTACSVTRYVLIAKPPGFR